MALFKPAKTVCLNLDKRFGERERIQNEFSRLGIDVNFFLAGSGELFPALTYDHIDITTPPTNVGYPWAQRMASYNAFLCFRKIIKQAKTERSSSLLILEDDVCLTDEAEEILHQVGDLPPFDLLYLGGNHTWGRTEGVSANLLRLRGGTQCWHAICLAESIYDSILALPLYSPIDDMCARFIQPTRRCYAVWPSIALQKPGFSYCDGKYQSYDIYWSSQGVV